MCLYIEWDTSGDVGVIEFRDSSTKESMLAHKPLLWKSDFSAATRRMAPWKKQGPQTGVTGVLQKCLRLVVPLGVG